MTIKHLYILLKLLPDKAWDDESIGRNISLTTKPHLFIIDNYLYVNEARALFIDKSLLKIKPHVEHWKLSIDFIREHIDEIDWYKLSASPNITCSFINNNLDLPWEWAFTIYNVNITREFMNEHAHKIYPAALGTLQEDALIYHKYLDFDILMKYADRNNLMRDYSWGIIKNKNFTYEIYKKYFEWQFPIRKLSSSQFITHIITDNNIWDFSWSKISKNKSINEEYVRTHMDYPWKWRKLTSNHNISFEFITNNIAEPWNIDDLANGINNNITFDTIKNNPEFPWNKGKTSANKSLTARIVLENPDGNWDWVAMSKNTFSVDHGADHIRDLMNKYVFKWRLIMRKNKKYKRDLFTHTLDIINLRIRDMNNGIRVTMI